MRVGVALDAGCSGVYIMPATAQQAGWAEGDHLQIESDDRCTVIVREVVECHATKGMKPDYIYLDEQSLDYLLCGLHEPVKVRRSAHSVDVPC